MPTRITATELARNLSDVLNRVRYRGEEFVVVRGGEVVADIKTASPSRGITVRESIDRIGDLPMPGAGFADDLADVLARQPLAENPEWPS